MKLLTVCIPCHNSIIEMHKAITSCLLMKEEVQVLVVDRNSHDETLEVAKEYEKAYPNTVKVVTTKDSVPFLKVALEHSEGLYFKVLQCYDYLDQPSLVSVVETIRDFIRIQANLDILFTDYKYSIPQEKEKRISYRKVFPTETIFEWHNVKSFHKYFQVDLAAIVIKTSTLKKVKDSHDSNICNELMIYGTIPYIKSMYYLEVPFHCYGSKRKISLDKVDHYVELMKGLWEFYDIYSLKSRRQRIYVVEYLVKIYVITMYLLLKNNREEDSELLNAYLAFSNPRLYKAINRRLYGMSFNTKYKTLNEMLIKLVERVYDFETE